MKTLLWIVVLFVIVAGGYYFFMMQPAAPMMETPTNESMGAKIDINVVCDGALAYMTFPSGAEAEAWVEACKRGEHPEAIEQYKVQMGIADSRM